jgi:hypothetical protein
MRSRNAFGTITCTILILVASSAAALGQNDPAADHSLPAKGEDSSSSFSETMADQSQGAGGCDLSGCESHGCPRWTASAEFIILDRVGGANQTLVERVPGFTWDKRVPGSTTFGELFSAPGTEALNGNDFQQGFCGGPRIGLIRQDDSGYDFEVSYFQIDGWHSDATIVPNDPADCLVMKAPGRWLSPAVTPGGWIGWIQTNQSATQAMAWEDATELHNAEFNVRWNPCSRVTMLAGFRWVNLHDDLQGELAPPTVRGEAPFWITTTNNNLYGFQIGADGKLLEHGCFSIDGLVKAGIYDNDAEQTTAVSVIAKQVKSASASTNRAAFVGETGLQCKYQVTKALLLKAGYEVIWLEGVALAPGQIQETYTTTDVLKNSVQALGVNCNSGVMYHGATVGFEYSF